MKNMESKLKTEIIPVPVQPLVSPEQAAAGWQLFLDLKKRLLTTDDYQTISGKKFITKSGFRKIAVAFNLSDRIIESERINRDDDSFYWRIVVEIEADNGRRSTGVAICDSKERKFAHVEHDVFATCHTRAKNRAISDMVAGGVASAEEMTSAAAKKPPSKGKTKLKSKVKEQTPVLDSNIAKALNAADLDVDILDIRYDLESEGLSIAVRGTMGKTLWQRYDSVLRKQGLSWDSSVKPNVWK